MRIAEGYAQVQEVARLAAGVCRRSRRDRYDQYAVVALLVLVGLACAWVVGWSWIVIGVLVFFAAIGFGVIVGQTAVYSIDAAGFHKRSWLPFNSWDVRVSDVQAVTVELNRLILTTGSGARTIAIDQDQFEALAPLYVSAAEKIQPISPLTLLWIVVASVAVLLLRFFPTGIRWLDAAINIVSPFAWLFGLLGVLLFAFRGYNRLRRR